MFGIVNMETFKHLCIVFVSCPKVFNRFNIVEERMEFRNVEVFLNESCNEIITALVKFIKSILHIAKGN